MKSCPQCARQFVRTDEFCPFDGIRLVPVVMPGEARTHGQHVLPGGIVLPPEESYDYLVGTVLDGRYAIEEKLGEGGMGVVFRARHTVIEKTVAVKVLKEEVAADQSLVQRFLQEAKAASRIGHPHIVDVTDFGVLPNGSAYSVMEFLSGVTLSRLLREEGTLSASRAVPIVAQISRALAAAHEKGIVHRDLKPENIFLLERDGQRDFVKIVDFGIAKVNPIEGDTSDGPRLTRAGMVFGTPEYMAPEQAAGRSDADHRVDIYALGMIFYELLVGYVPHKSDSPVAILAMQILDPIIPPRHAVPGLAISEEMERVVMTALAKEREERFDSMGALLAALEHASQFAPAPVGPPVPVLSLAGTTSAPLGPVAREIAPTAVDLPSTPATADDPSTVSLRPAPSQGQKRRHRAAIIGGTAGLALAITALTALALIKHYRAAAVPSVSSSSPAGASTLVANAPPAIGMLPSAQPATGPLHLDASTTSAPPTPATSSTHAAALPTPEPLPEPTPPQPAPPPPTRAQPTPKPLLDVMVKTHPPGGELFVDRVMEGVDGTTFRREQGTRMDITCRLAGHDPGRVSVVFDQGSDMVTCVMKRKARCVRDLKNPFDTCPDP
ncbi:MAG: protein kinase [Deltaproteobacteria bacterium]|nr:protein kinase [Deltaproteobacteria bacterium]